MALDTIELLKAGNGGGQHRIFLLQVLFETLNPFLRSRRCHGVSGRLEKSRAL